MRVFKTILYWFVSLTWGLLMSTYGLLCAFALLISGHKPKIFHYSVYFEAGSGWGGFEAGCFFIVNKNPSLSLKQHEHGHGIQNLMLGPLFPFLVGIPSALRYWLREMPDTKKRILFTIFAPLCLLALFSPLIICGFYFNILWLWILGLSIYTYIISLCIWLAVQIPQYKTSPWPTYDSFWPEGWATSIGQKLFKT